MTYSLKFREEVLATKAKEKLTIAETAQKFNVGFASVAIWLKNIEPKKNKNRPQLKLNLTTLKKDIQNYPDASQEERAQRLGVSQVSVGFALKKLNVKYLKISSDTRDNQKQKFCILPCYSNTL